MENKESEERILEAAEQGNADAQSNLGTMYLYGIGGVAQDYSEALRWFRKSAEQGNAEGQRNLGLMYDRGMGVVQDYEEASKWYRMAAEQGNAVAQFNLGEMYDQGRGVIQDHIHAHMWFNLSAAGSKGTNQEQAAKQRDSVARKMTAQQIAEAQRLAREWKPTQAK